MQVTMICAGLGGQGALTAGKILLHAGVHKDMKATWFPTYGNEMRGGTALCNVILSDERIASPYCDHPDIVMALAESSVDDWMDVMAPGGKLFVNSSLIPEDKEYRDDIEVIKCPATDIAIGLNSERNANIVMVGKIIKETDFLDIEDVKEAMCAYFEEEGKGKFNEKNVEVLMAGYNA